MNTTLSDFRSAHEKISGILLDAMRYGPTPHVDQQYRQYRTWMLKTYEALRDDLAPFLDGTETGSHIDQRTADALEKLIEPPTLFQALQRDQRRIVARIDYIREALELCESSRLGVN